MSMSYGVPVLLENKIEIAFSWGKSNKFQGAGTNIGQSGDDGLFTAVLYAKNKVSSLITDLMQPCAESIIAFGFCTLIMSNERRFFNH